MGEKIGKLKPNTTVPGAGEYNPNLDSLKRSFPSYSMKIKLGSSLTTKTGFVPGPGNYGTGMNDKRASPKYGFGSSTRESGKKINLVTPGPGTYKLKNMIGDVPEHAMPGRSDD